MSQLVLVIGNKAYSSWSLRPWLAMKHTGIDFTEKRLSLYAEGAKESILRYSAAGKVPVLKDGDLTVWDSLAICEYLAEKFPNKHLWPADAARRAVARAVSAEMHSGFTNIRNQMPMNVRREIPGHGKTPEVAAEVARVATIWNDCLARHAAGGSFLFGTFSIADAMYAPVASRFVSYGVAIDESTRAYVDTLMNLDAMQEWLRDAEAEATTSTDTVTG